jgi:hypothetical protein
VKGAERIVRFAAATGLGKDHAPIVDLVKQLVARLKVQCGADRLRNGGLRLGRKLARDHDGPDSIPLIVLTGLLPARHEGGANLHLQGIGPRPK